MTLYGSYAKMLEAEAALAAARAPDCFCIGLDLGRQIDPSALAMLQWHRPRWGDPRPVYECPTLARWPLGTPYREIVLAAARFLKGAPVCTGYPVLVLDATGVGAAVAEMAMEQLRFEQVGGGFVEVVITAGGAVTQDLGRPGSWRVAKKQLASVVQVLLGNRRLHIAEGLQEAKTLKDELGKFTVKITEALNETYEAWREQDHDDLVLAVALAAWAAETLDVFRPAQPAVSSGRLIA
jgi:hypothetical protein